MKKVLAVIAVVTVVFAAGSALAQPKFRQNFDQRRGQQVVQDMPNPHVDQRQGQQFAGDPRFNDRGPRFEGKGNEMPCRGRQGMRGGFGEHMPMFAPDMPEEIRAIVVEVAKLKIDLHAEMSKKPIDKAKALEIFGKIQKAEQEVEVWKFGQRLERIEAFRKQMELNRNVPPAPKAEAPEVPAEKAE